ncbi:alpha/beta fold hydrolase [Knoellia aerolata]|uniref:AB hydrolase-1 domain-containing protein n=1 Tax=Knoellia aerolata DSM 18566 TaxID=1385519 RepID=A0A0A0JT64_9MICO|nr:alpha/beta hydrolase [Knoellia aerolata]KGN40353.1 hypothetical protein N801_14770 [Knoellia aerolata DSM 18566]
MTEQLSGPRVRSHPSALHERYVRMVRAAGAEGRFIRAGSARVHVIEAGDGPVTVHLHANNTSSLSHLMLLEHLTAVRSVLVDRPGFGLSEPVDVPRASFRDTAVRFVDEVLDSLRVDSAVLVGASGGGSWAVWYALARPERVRGLVLLGSVPLMPGSRIPVPIRLLATPVVGTLLSRTVRPNRRMVSRLMSSMGEGETIRRHPDLLDSLVDAARDPLAVAANGAEFRALLSPIGPRPAARIRADDLRRLAVPTLMVGGTHDPVLPVTQARAVAALIPDARLELLPAGHVPQLGNPQRVAALVERFTLSVAHPTDRDVVARLDDRLLRKETHG